MRFPAWYGTNLVPRRRAGWHENCMGEGLPWHPRILTRESVNNRPLNSPPLGASFCRTYVAPYLSESRFLNNSGHLANPGTILA